MQQDTEFIARLRDRNLMSLRAFVRIPDRFSLVYDYIPNSSLENTMNRVRENQSLIGKRDAEFEPRLTDCGLDKLMPNSKLNKVGKISSLEDCISIGPWGGGGGESWAYKPQGRISQIVVQHGLVVDSILFQSRSSDGLVDYSEKFGGPGGGRTEGPNGCTAVAAVHPRTAAAPIPWVTCLNIDYPEEHLTAMDMTVGEFCGYDVVTSVCFHTNVTKYGPFGKTTGTSILIPMESAIVVGFHGRSGSYLDAIGFFAKPQRSASSSSSSCVSHDYETINAMKLGVVPRDPGPWGGSGGKHWDDGVFSRVKNVNVYTANDEEVVRAVKFKYMKRDGDSVWSLLHGYSGTVNEFKGDERNIERVIERANTL
ncbi:unnamed protein product [Camellia sinensis]